MSVDNYKPLYIWRSPASIPQIVAHIQDYLVKHPILSTETIAEIIVDALGDHPELLNGSVIPITQDSAQSIKAYIDSLPILDTYTKAQIDSLLEGKEDALTFDTTPTEDSGNPVTSGGIYSVLAALDTALQLMIADKADISSVYTKAQTDSLLLDKADADNVYSKNTIEAKLLTKANIDSVYSIQDVDTMRIVNNANMAIRTTDNLAPIDLSAGQYVYLGDILYMTTAPVLTGDELIPGTNCVLNPTGALNRIGDGLQNVAAQTNIQAGEISGLQGDVSSLSGQIGDLEDLETSAQTDLVSAVNENKNAIDERAKLFTTQTITIASIGYITGSGNYFNFFIPLACDPSKTYAITNVANTGFFMTDGRHDYAFNTLTVIQKTSNGLFVELHFTATQTPNMLGLFRGDLTITVQ